MTDYKQGSEIKKYLKNKKRQKRIKKIILGTIVITVATILFCTQAPIFNIETIEVLGTSKISSDNLKNNLKDTIGENIFTVNIDSIKELLLKDKYVKEVKISRKGISGLEIDIIEESPVFYVDANDMINIINENLEVIEQIESTEGRNLVKIEGIDFESVTLGEKINKDEIYSIILREFYPYIAQNREEIKIDVLDIGDIVNIKGKIGEVEIFFGDDSNLRNKMENIYRILLSEEVKLTKGYIDVSFDGPPIIKKISN